MDTNSISEKFELWNIFINTNGVVYETYIQSGTLNDLKARLTPGEKYKSDVGGMINEPSIRSNDYYQEVRDQRGEVVLTSDDLFDEKIIDAEVPIYQYQRGVVVC